MDAGSLLRHARKKAGLSQRQLAARSGVAQPSIARIEGGTTTPRFDTLRRLLAVCGYDLELARRLGQGLDRTAMRELLDLPPEERLHRAVEEARNLERLLGSEG